MGHSGSPIDHQAWDARRAHAARLLALGYSYAVVARSVGASKAWVQNVAAEQREAAKSNSA